MIEHAHAFQTSKLPFEATRRKKIEIFPTKTTDTHKSALEIRTHLSLAGYPTRYWQWRPTQKHSKKRRLESAVDRESFLPSARSRAKRNSDVGSSSSATFYTTHAQIFPFLLVDPRRIVDVHRPWWSSILSAARDRERAFLSQCRLECTVTRKRCCHSDAFKTYWISSWKYWICIRRVGIWWCIKVPLVFEVVQMLYSLCIIVKIINDSGNGHVLQIIFGWNLRFVLS